VVKRGSVSENVDPVFLSMKMTCFYKICFTYKISYEEKVLSQRQSNPGYRIKEEGFVNYCRNFSKIRNFHAHFNSYPVTFL
jgi:hypothetical protein